nr:putative RNA-directed DNA polymerase, eukaryota [Tanacetum cinerariifolium]
MLAFENANFEFESRVDTFKDKDALQGNISVVALDRKLSDHCPIVIRNVELEFRPNPFRVFDVWMEDLDFFCVMEEAWRKEIRSAWPNCRFRDRLKNVKASLRVWSKDSERISWLELRKQWEIKEREYSNMLRQKSRIKWDAEGDENSKFFHAFVRRKNNKCNLRGLMVDGEWCEAPKTIKAQMARHYKNLFSDGGMIRSIFCSNKIVKNSVEKSRMLERGFSETEVWEAICGCGVEKAPGPDGFNFKFIKKS